MQKIVFADKTEFEILEGASLGNITVLCNDFAALGNFTTALKKKGNLDSVQFKQDEQVTGEYEKLLLTSSTYFNVDIDEASKILASFSLREKSKLEIAVETIQVDQLTQDDAIMELAEMIGGQA
jgi:D-arabinose 1-dehydrogenase-like Zn-dependent alcohol dehydrogenase